MRASTGDTGDGPFFFLSYTHSHRRDGLDPDDPDQLIGRLFKDLCDHISDETGRLASTVGFMDRELQPGNEKERTAFHDRARNGSAHASGHVEAILPVLWRPIPHQALPEAASEIHFNPAEIGQIYAEYGIYGIMKLTRFSEEYEWVIYDLAERILRIAVVVVWNRKDAEMSAAEGELRRALAEAMPSRLNARGRATSQLAWQGVPSLSDITPALQDAMSHAARQYLKYARAHPPGSPTEVTFPPPPELADG